MHFINRVSEDLMMRFDDERLMHKNYSNTTTTSSINAFAISTNTTKTDIDTVTETELFNETLFDIYCLCCDNKMKFMNPIDDIDDIDYNFYANYYEFIDDWSDMLNNLTYELALSFDNESTILSSSPPQSQLVTPIIPVSSVNESNQISQPQSQSQPVPTTTTTTTTNQSHDTNILYTIRNVYPTSNNLKLANGSTKKANSKDTNTKMSINCVKIMRNNNNNTTNTNINTTTTTTTQQQQQQNQYLTKYTDNENQLNCINPSQIFPYKLTLKRIKQRDCNIKNDKEYDDSDDEEIDVVSLNNNNNTNLNTNSNILTSQTQLIDENNNFINSNNNNNNNNNTTEITNNNDNNTNMNLNLIIKTNKSKKIKKDDLINLNLTNSSPTTTVTTTTTTASTPTPTPTPTENYIKIKQHNNENKRNNNNANSNIINNNKLKRKLSNVTDDTTTIPMSIITTKVFKSNLFNINQEKLNKKTDIKQNTNKNYICMLDSDDDHDDTSDSDDLDDYSDEYSEDTDDFHLFNTNEYKIKADTITVTAVEQQEMQIQQQQQQQLQQIQPQQIKRSRSNISTTTNQQQQQQQQQQQSGYSSDNPAEKRAFHILSERQRRNDLKKLFETLRTNIPNLCDKQKASKLTILKAAVDHLNDITNKQMKLNLIHEREKQRHLQLMHNLKVLQANTK